MKNAHEALALSFIDPDSGDMMTIRDYLKLLLTTLYEEGEGFSGKRPFGNSGWEGNLAEPLITAGFLKGSVYRDEDGDIEDINFEWSAYNKCVFAMIEAL